MRQKITKWAKIATIEELLELDKKVVDYVNSVTDNSYKNSGTKHYFYNENLKPESDGYYYMPATNKLIESGLFDGVELIENPHE